jgi:predicted RND superfamily exporter protein
VIIPRTRTPVHLSYLLTDFVTPLSFMSNSFSKIANVATILSFPFASWALFACLLLAVAYLSVDWWKELARNHAPTECIRRLDNSVDRVEWEVLAPKEHLLSEEQCKEAKNMIKR